jgi:hypothetical protein
MVFSELTATGVVSMLDVPCVNDGAATIAGVALGKLFTSVVGFAGAKPASL